MNYSIWTYPWDLLDLGIEQALTEIAQAKLTGVSLTTSYHTGRFLQPRSSKRKVYFPEDGTLYFPFQKKNTVLCSSELQEIMPARTQLYFLSLLTPDKSWLFGIRMGSFSTITV